MDYEKFRSELDEDRMYRVKSSKHYTHVLPRDASYNDLKELWERKRKFGEKSLLEDSKVYGRTLLG